MDNWLHGMDYTAIEMANSKRFLDLWQTYCRQKTKETRDDLKQYLLKTVRNDTSIRRLAILMKMEPFARQELLMRTTKSKTARDRAERKL